MPFDIKIWIYRRSKYTWNSYTITWKSVEKKLQKAKRNLNVAEIFWDIFSRDNWDKDMFKILLLFCEKGENDMSFCKRLKRNIVL